MPEFTAQDALIEAWESDDRIYETPSPHFIEGFNAGWKAALEAPTADLPPFPAYPEGSEGPIVLTGSEPRYKVEKDPKTGDWCIVDSRTGIIGSTYYDREGAEGMALVLNR